MKSAVETLNPTRVKLTIEVPQEELKPHLDAAYKTIGSQIQVPGFRAGKVPARIIDQRVGKGAVMQEAVNEALPEFFGKAVEENDLQPLGQPEVDITAVPLEGNENLEFTVEVDVRPEVTLPDYAGYEIEVDDIKVTDEDIAKGLEELQARFGTLVGVDRAVEDGDFVSIDLKAEIDGTEIDSVSGVSYEVGSGNMLEGMDAALIGMAAGDTKTFQAPLAGGDQEGQDADCTVTVQSVKVRELPELDDEFAQLASEFDTIDELKADVSAKVEQQKKFVQGLQARDRVLEKLLADTDIPLPESIVEAEIHSHLEGEGRLEDDVHRAEVDESTRSGLKTQFLLDALALKEEVQVEQQELIEYLVMQSQQYGMDPNSFAQMIDQQGQIPAIMGEVGRRKALAAVLDQAKIVDASGNVIDLDELVPSQEEDDAELVHTSDSGAVEAPEATKATEVDATDADEAKA